MLGNFIAILHLPTWVIVEAIIRIDGAIGREKPNALRVEANWREPCVPSLDARGAEALATTAGNKAGFMFTE